MWCVVIYLCSLCSCSIQGSILPTERHWRDTRLDAGHVGYVQLWAGVLHNTKCTKKRLLYLIIRFRVLGIFCLFRNSIFNSWFAWRRQRTKIYNEHKKMKLRILYKITKIRWRQRKNRWYMLYRFISRCSISTINIVKLHIHSNN